MVWRLLSYLICLLLGAVGGGGLSLWLDSPASAGSPRLGWWLCGMLLGSLIWFVLDFIRGVRLLGWIRSGDTASSVVAGGVWGELSDRVRRQLRTRENETRASDARLQDFLQALQASPNGVVLLDETSRIEWFNQTAAGHFGFEAGRDQLQHIGNLVREPAFAAYFSARDFRAGVEMPGRDHSLNRPVRLAVQLHPYGAGRLLLLSRDITAVQQAETMRRDFVANVSHEIRTPLTVLSGFVETMQSLPLDEAERERYLGLMAQQAQRMQTLVSDLLTLSRLEGSPPVSGADWVSVPSLLMQTQQDMRNLSEHLAQAAGHGPAHELVFEAAPALELAAAGHEILSAMTNLAGNAVRYTPLGGVIRMGWVQLPDGRSEFSVQDSGPGIAAEHIPRLTERFYRVDRSRSRDTGGTGLGLAIVKHVAQRHGAELKIQSTPGKGSRFALVFPASRVRVARIGP
jgi:two-component system, OmpR family, phosphate regulon sensor histidine kinase PhoR